MPWKKPFITGNAPPKPKPSPSTSTLQSHDRPSQRTLSKDPADSPLDSMKSQTRSASGSPRDLVRLRAWRLDSLGEPPQVTFDDLGSKLNMDDGLFTGAESHEKHTNGQSNGQTNGQINGQTNGAGVRIPSSSYGGSSLRPGLVSPVEENAGGSGWSSAVGHASTGKSGRVIERLQGDIDRLNRDKLVWKARFEEAEKTNETLNTRNTFLLDRNSNLELSHDANLRQISRKDRMIEELRDDLRREKSRTAAAEQNAQAASVTEEKWREEAAKSRAFASQKEQEYESIVSCRTMDNERHQSAFDRLKDNLDRLLDERKSDQDTQRRLEIIAEQQSQTIKQLEELNRRLTSNNQAYRAELDSTLTQLRTHSQESGGALDKAIEEMHEARDKMKWVVNVQKNVPGAK